MDDEDSYFSFLWEIRPPYRRFVWAVIRMIGWYVIGIAVALVYAWPYVKNIYKTFRKKIDDKAYDAKYKKDPDHSAELLSKMQLAREKMQEEFIKNREIELQQEKEKKERKLQELLAYRDGTASGDEPSSSSASSSSKLRFRGGYNPLMGGGGGGKYVPEKRSCCKKGGGCG